MKTLQKILGISALSIAPILYGCGEADNSPIIHKPKLPAEAPETPVNPPKKKERKVITGIVIGEVHNISGDYYSYSFSIQSKSENPGIYSFIMHHKDALLIDSRVGIGDEVSVDLTNIRGRENSFHANSYSIYDRNVISVSKAKKNLSAEEAEEK